MRFSGNITYTTRSTIICWLPEAVGIDANGCDMLNNDDFALFGQRETLWIHMGAKWKIEICEALFFWRKYIVYIWLQNSQSGDSFRMLLDLASSPGKKTEGIRKQWCIQ